MSSAATTLAGHGVCFIATAAVRPVLLLSPRGVPAADVPALMVCQGLRARASTPTSLPVRTIWSSAWAVSDEVTASPGQATAR
jgi:hypothetical protein